MKYFLISILLVGLVHCTPKETVPDSKTAQEERARKAKEEFEKKLDADFATPLQPDLSEKRPFRGAKNAKVVLVVYSDFQCPFCSRGFQTLEQVREKYPNDVKIIFKHMPLEMHSAAETGARYFEAIALQDEEKAWKFHDTLFLNQDQLGEEAEKYMKSTAKSLKVDMKKLAKDIKSDAVTKRLKADSEETRKFRFTGAPSFIVGGVRVVGAKGFPLFEKIIDRHLKPKS